jgi:hypothetical protein
MRSMMVRKPKTYHACHSSVSSNTHNTPFQRTHISTKKVLSLSRITSVLLLLIVVKFTCAQLCFYANISG